MTTEKHIMATFGSCANTANRTSWKSKVITSAPIVNGDAGKSVINRTRRFYIDDILGFDFGRRFIEDCKSVGSELNENQWTVADSDVGNQQHRSDIADCTVSQHGDTSSELDKCTDALVLPSTTSRTPSLSVTSAQCFVASSGGSSKGSNRQALPKDTVVAVLRSSSSKLTEVTPDDVTHVTSSTASHSVTAMLERKTEYQSGGKDPFTLPAWVYCTRYSDRPSSGNILTMLTK